MMDYLFGSALGGSAGQRAVDSEVRMQNLEVIQRRQQPGEAWYYGGLTWSHELGKICRCSSGPFLSRAEADAMTVRQALSMGYTKPRWWQFWRIGEHPLPTPENSDG